MRSVLIIALLASCVPIVKSPGEECPAPRPKNLGCNTACKPCQTAICEYGAWEYEDFHWEGCNPDPLPTDDPSCHIGPTDPCPAQCGGTCSHLPPDSDPCHVGPTGFCPTVARRARRSHLPDGDGGSTVAHSSVSSSGRHSRVKRSPARPKWPPLWTVQRGSLMSSSPELTLRHQYAGRCGTVIAYVLGPGRYAPECRVAD